MGRTGCHLQLALRRCAEFAQELSGRLSRSVKTDERLKNRFWHLGRPHADEIRRDDPLRLENFWRDPVGNRPEGAETLASFQARVSAVWTEISTTHRGQRVLIVGTPVLRA